LWLLIEKLLCLFCAVGSHLADVVESRNKPVFSNEGGSKGRKIKRHKLVEFQIAELEVKVAAVNKDKSAFSCHIIKNLQRPFQVLQAV